MKYEHICQDLVDRVNELESAIEQALERMNGYDLFRFGDDLKKVLEKE